MKKVLRAIALSLGVTALTIASAVATPVTMDVLWSGASFGNNAKASAVFTLDETLPTSSSAIYLPNPKLTGLSLTISGAAAGNGTFTNQIHDVVFWAPSSLDFSRQLIGQALSNGCTFGSRSNSCVTISGDFNLFTYSNPGEPTGVSYFVLATSDGERMAVTSMIAESAIPEPDSVALFGIAALGLALGRRKKAA